MATFTWGAAGAQQTPEQIAAQRKIAQLLMEKGMNDAPVQHWSQGMNRVLQGMMGGYDSYRSDQSERANRDSDNALLQSFIGGGGGSADSSGLPTSPQSAVKTAQPMGTLGPTVPPEAFGTAPMADTPALMTGGTFGATASAAPSNDKQRYAYDFYLKKGYSPVQAAGIVGGLRGETANLNTTETHDGGIGLGISGWNGSRLANLKSFAQQNGQDHTSLDTQLAFVDHELKSSERGAYSRLQNASTPQDAGNAMLQYFRPKDWNVPGAHGERARYAAQTFQRYGQGGPPPADAMPQTPVRTQVASADPGFMPSLGAAPGMPPVPNGEAQPPMPAGFAPQPQGSAVERITNLLTRPAQPPAPPQQMAQAAPQAMPPQSGGAPHVDPRILYQTLASRTAGDGVKKVAAMLLQQQLGEKVTYTTTPEGAVLALDPKGKLPPRLVYQSAQKPTGNMQDLDRENADRAKAGQPPLSMVEFKKAGATTNSVSIDQRQETEFNKKAGQVQAERFDKVVQAGMEAQGMAGDLSALNEIGARISTGKTAEVIAALGPYAEAAGIKIDGLDDMQAYRSIVAKLAPRMRVPGSGATSDYEMRQFLEALPGLGKTPGGNEMVSNTLQALTQHRIAASEIASRALAGEIKPAEAEKQLRELPNPLELWKKNGRALSASKPAAAAGGAPPPPKPGDTMDGHRFKGGNPADPNSWEKLP